MRNILLCNLVAFGFACAAHGLTIPASEDTMGYGNTLLKASGALPSLNVDGARTSYIYFDLNDIPSDAVVRWAKLRLFLPTVRTKGAGLGVHLVTGTWNEALASMQPAIDQGTLGVIEPEKLASKRFVTVDITSTVQSWISGGTSNEGLAVTPIIKAGMATASVMLTSKEGTILGLPAELDIEFQPEGFEQLQNTVKGLLTPRAITVGELPEKLMTVLAPTITEQPFVSLDGGSLCMKAQGLGSLKYQWFRDGVRVTGGTGQMLPVAQVRPLDNGHLLNNTTRGGTYSVSVNNGVFSVSSSPIEYRPMPPRFACVSGGRLPDSSVLGTVSVGTFFLGTTEVYWEEFKLVQDWANQHGYDIHGQGNVVQYAGTTSVTFMGEDSVCRDFPVSNLYWYDAIKWCNARSEMEGKTAVYMVGGEVYRSGMSLRGESPEVNDAANGYRLPTEAEWEFAARGGVLTRNYLFSGSDNLDAVAWHYENSDRSVHSVARKMPNELGLFDMLGNVGEMCFDRPRESSNLTHRGGSFTQVAENLWSSGRFYMGPYVRDYSTGFRVAINNLAPTGYSLIPRGEFTMGDAEMGIQIRNVYLDEYYIAQTELSYGEWRIVRDWALKNGYDFTNSGSVFSEFNYKDDSRIDFLDKSIDPQLLPVSGVNWYDAIKWCNARSEMEGRVPCYYVNSSRDFNSVYRSGGKIWMRSGNVNWSANGYRLPTEAEWEKAARGGVSGRAYAFAGDIDPSKARYSGDAPDSFLTEAVKSFQPNEFGLYQMTGNVKEWCWDVPGANSTSSDGEVVRNPTGPDDYSSSRCQRGGGWSDGALFEYRVGWRGGTYDDISNVVNGHLSHGFRCVIKP